MYTLRRSDRTEDMARMLLEHMVMFYDPPLVYDDDCDVFSFRRDVCLTTHRSWLHIRGTQPPR